MAEERRPDEYGDQGQQQESEHQQEESPESSPPSKVARFSTDKSSSDADVVTTAVASPLVLGLGLGVGGKEAEVESPSKAGFTFMQMQEFHHQALIFKHMVAGIPVPIHLILPIWKSVAASYGPHHYPSFVGLGNLCYDFRNSMEPEPGRCRRTDGKKWRCSREVVPDQKYCERHMHRGRNRSRKPVEGAAADANSAFVAPTTTTNNNNNTASNLSITIQDDDAPATTNNNANSISSDNIINSNDVSTARMIGSSPTSVLISSTACKTVAS